MDEATVASIRAIVEYLEGDEHKHYEECGKPPEHIYVYVKVVREWLDKSDREFGDET